MASKHRSYWDYDPEEMLTCESCGWQGPANDSEPFDACLEVYCGECGRRLLLVSYPTPAETRVAAKAGNQKAQRELQYVEQREEFLTRADDLALKRPDQLPDLDGTEIRIAWDYERGDDGEGWTILRHNGREIWRELAYFEGYPRFGVVFEILHERYGSRLAAVEPTEASLICLYGDKCSAPDALITRLNRSLRPRDDDAR